MHLFVFLTIVFSTFQHATAWGTLWLQTGANITFFQTTIRVPSNPTVIQSPSNSSFATNSSVATNYSVQAAWPGLNNAHGSSLLQNAVTNSDVALNWVWDPWYCCDPPTSLINYTPAILYPGDQVTSTFSYNQFTNTWLDTWLVMPGPSASAAGVGAYAGSVVFDPNSYHVDGPFTNAIFALEFYGPLATSWDSGAVTFTDTIIHASGSDDSWCKGLPFVTGGGLQYASTQLEGSVMDVGQANGLNGDEVACYIRSITIYM